MGEYGRQPEHRPSYWRFTKRADDLYLRGMDTYIKIPLKYTLGSRVYKSLVPLKMPKIWFKKKQTHYFCF